jgi:hypothetical protein
MNALLALPRQLVLDSMIVEWPMEGNIWFEVVRDAMRDQGYDYPARIHSLHAEYLQGKMPGEIYEEARSEMRAIIVMVQTSYEQRYQQVLQMFTGEFLFSSVVLFSSSDPCFHDFSDLQIYPHLNQLVGSRLIGRLLVVPST